MNEDEKRGFIGSLRWFVQVLASAATRFYWDDCFSRASALAYTTLFSLAPLVALSASMFYAFGLDEQNVNSTIKELVYTLLPSVQNAQVEEFQQEVYSQLEQFSHNVSALNTLSIAILVVSGILLFNTIESALNVIWRTTSKLTVVAKIVSFWAVLTLTPALIAVSVYASAKVRLLAEQNLEINPGYFAGLGVFLPVLTSWVAITLLLYKMPAAKVRLSHAALGGFVTALLFEAVKWGFAHYVSFTTTYSKIYASFAAVPLFLVLLYCGWVVVLFGAEVTHQAASVNLSSGTRKYATDLGEIGALLGLRMLQLIGKRFASGEEPPTESDLARETGSDPELVVTCLDVLTGAKILTGLDDETHSRALLLAPDKLELRRVFEAFMTREHLESKAEGEELDAGFLEIFSSAVQQPTSKKVMEKWSLSEFVEASGKGA